MPAASAKASIFSIWLSLGVMSLLFYEVANPEHDRRELPLAADDVPNAAAEAYFVNVPSDTRVCYNAQL
jgi:hypothetical protein